MTDEHANILIRIHSRDEDSEAYPIEAELDDGSRFLNGEFHLDRQALQAVASDPEQYGLDLFYDLFSGLVVGAARPRRKGACASVCGLTMTPPSSTRFPGNASITSTGGNRFPWPSLP